jgi:hypothetical protein
MRPTFDRERALIVNKPMKFNGKKFGMGDVFDPSLTTTRRLRQLYEGRWLKHGPYVPKPVEPTPTKPVMPEFKQLSTDGLRQWLTNHNASPTPRIGRARLIELAATKWKELYDGEPAANGASEPDSAGLRRPADDGDTTAGQPDGR